MNYFGIDWIANILILIATIILGKRNSLGFILFAVSNVMFFILGIMIESIALCIFMCIMFVINIQSYRSFNATNLRK